MKMCFFEQKFTQDTPEGIYFDKKAN
jgi:hypothetical protein